MIYNSFVFKHWHFMIELYPTGLLILLLQIIIWCHILPLISLKADLARHDFSMTDRLQNITEFRNLSDYIMCHFSSHRGATPAIKKLLFDNSFLTKESCYLWAGEREWTIWETILHLNFKWVLRLRWKALPTVTNQESVITVDEQRDVSVFPSW